MVGCDDNLQKHPHEITKENYDFTEFMVLGIFIYSWRDVAILKRMICQRTGPNVVDVVGLDPCV